MWRFYAISSIVMAALAVWTAVDHRDPLGDGWTTKRIAVVLAFGLWSIACARQALIERGEPR